MEYLKKGKADDIGIISSDFHHGVLGLEQNQEFNNMIKQLKQDHPKLATEIDNFVKKDIDMQAPEADELKRKQENGEIKKEDIK